jgi:hypothetical protein
METAFQWYALKFLIQWKQKEETLHHAMTKTPPILADVRKALTYFGVARNFTGLNKDGNAKYILDSLPDISGNVDLTIKMMVKEVTSLADKFANRFKKNLSAASKLLWLRHRHPFIIYDGRAIKALKLTANGLKYEEYCDCWRRQYQENIQAIKEASLWLATIRSFLPVYCKAETNFPGLVGSPWFKERIFDTYLWEIGE